MKTGIGRILQIDTANRVMLMAMLVQAVCTGFFAGTLELSASVMFLESNGPAKVPLAMMVSGAAGILIAVIYSYFSKQLKLRSFGIINFVAVLAFTAAVIGGIFFLSPVEFDFIVFVFMGPMLLITLMSFWITVKGFLSPSRGKQISGLVEAVLTGGMVFAFFVVPLLNRAGIPVRIMIFVGLASLVAATLAQLFVLSRMGTQLEYPVRRVSSTGPIRLFSHRYTGLISTFAALGVAVMLVLQYAFLWVASDQYSAGLELLLFFGVFSGFMVLSGWALKRFLFSKIHNKFGLSSSLLVMPVLLLLLTLASLIIGDLTSLGPKASLIPYFFMFVILSRFLSGVWKYSMEQPSMNVIFQTLNPSERNNIQSGIEGVLGQIAYFAMGLFLACYVMIFLEIIHVAYLLSILIIAWFFTGLSLVRSYRKMLRITLESERLKDPLERKLEELSRVDLRNTAYPIESLDFNPYFFHYVPREELISQLEHRDPAVRIRIWDHMMGASPGLSALKLSQLLGNEPEPAIKERIRSLSRRKLRGRLGLQEAFIRERIDRFTEERNEMDPAIGEAFQSGVANEVFAALYHVAELRDRTYLPEVVQLLREQDQSLRSVAISTAGLLDSRRLSVLLIESLEHPRLYAEAWSALVRQGELVLEELEAAFYKPEVSLKLQLRIISVLSAIGGEKSMELLLSKLDYHQTEVFKAAIAALYENHFRASQVQVATIQNVIFRLVETGAWNLAAKISVRTDNPGGALHTALEHEIWDVNESILVLLAMIYDRSSVYRIRVILLEKHSAEKGMGIELLNLLLEEPLKQFLVSYFTDVFIREKIDKLQTLFRLDLIPMDLLLRKILNRDGMQMGDFIRICVLERMGNVLRYFDEQQIIAQGFHPNPQIRETAAQILRKNDPGRFNSVTERPDFADNVFPDHEDAADWYENTTINLSAWKLFNSVGINTLFRLVSVLQPFSEELLQEGDMVVLAKSARAGSFTSLSEGIAIIADHHPEVLEQIRYLGAEGESEAYVVEREEFIELLFDDRSLLHAFGAFLSRAGRPRA